MYPAVLSICFRQVLLDLGFQRGDIGFDDLFYKLAPYRVISVDKDVAHTLYLTPWCLRMAFLEFQCQLVDGLSYYLYKLYYTEILK
nr:hypothetical protein [uncultured Muribaculum sp.]